MRSLLRPLVALERRMAALSGVAILALTVALCVAVAGLLALSYRSMREWRTSSRNLAEHRAEMMLTLLSTALNRDMKAVHTSVLLPLELEDLLRDPPFDLREIFARAFARFPYAESFFVWKAVDGEQTFFAFHRDDRLPPWDPSRRQLEAYPAVLRRNPAEGRVLADALMQHVVPGRRFTVFDLVLADTPYQIVAKVLPGPVRGEVAGVVGFTVNLRWVRQRYFSQLAAEVSRIGDATGSIPLAIQDEEGVDVTVTRAIDPTHTVRQRQFSPVFFDPVMLSTLAPEMRSIRPWAVKVGTADDPMMIAASRQTYVVLTAAALVSVVGMLLTARAVKARAELAAMQSDFVSTVTHELKTPLSFIRLLGETLGNGRYDSLDTIRDYARLLSQEAWRLTRLIENLLTFSRLNSKSKPAPFEALEVAEVVDDALVYFRPRLAEQSFELTVDLPSDLPRIQGDRASLIQALDNLVDNAIKYSDDRRSITIRGWVGDERHLWLDVADRGMGIPAEEQSRVFDKFYRGRGVRAGGSGLGLAIVRQVMDEHRGGVEIRSTADGTAVRLVLPLDASHE